MRKRRLLNPITWSKCIASTIALISNAVQLSEVADEWGSPSPRTDPKARAAYMERAKLVAFEALQLRRHVGAA